MSSKPTNIKLYESVKQRAKSKFKVYPSVYANSWIVREYIKLGGIYSGKKSKEGLTRWYREEWIDVCVLPKKVKCGRDQKLTDTNWMEKYPYCRPNKRISKNTPRTVKEISQQELSHICKQKRKSPTTRMQK